MSGKVILDERVPVTMKDEVPNHFEAARMMFNDWMTLLDELLNPASHQVRYTSNGDNSFYVVNKPTLEFRIDDGSE